MNTESSLENLRDKITTLVNNLDANKHQIKQSDSSLFLLPPSLSCPGKAEFLAV